MIGEIGHYSLILSLGFASLLALFPMVGAHYHHIRLMQSANTLTYGVFFSCLLSIVLLMIGFAQDDFSLTVVAQHSNINLPMIYKITALWGGHEGSLLLWMFILAVWMAAVAFFLKSGAIGYTIASLSRYGHGLYWLCPVCDLNLEPL
jgi:cytochrome c-type biogenesis protein CcmF